MTVFPKARRKQRVALIAMLSVALFTLAGCQGPTSVEQGGEGGQFQVRMKIDPLTLNPPQLATLSFRLTDSRTNKAVTELQSIGGPVVHNIVIRSDLGYFRHSTTQAMLENAASLLTYFPTVGTYYTYSLYRPAGAETQIFTATVATGSGEQEKELVFDTNASRTSGGVKVQMLSGSEQIRANQPVQLGFFVSEHGSPISDLWPLYDEPGHLWIVDENGGSFAHLTAASNSRHLSMQSTPSASQTAGRATSTLLPAPTIASGLSGALGTATAMPTAKMAPVQQTAQAAIMGTPDVVPDVGYGPELLFTHTFPHEGPYKMWLELKNEDLTLQFDFAVRVVK
ncbi:MAG TPA: hypothetical protein VM409_01965 [Chloroflexia bacterium]|nr:hypothetical protein [Chloroflexia bacterium]